MTVEEFEEAVELAKVGGMKSCNGATDAIVEALNAIIDADPQDVNESVTRAHSVYQAYLSDTGYHLDG
jgi:hypothetical protein